jgi:hypothetical protein
MFNSSSAALPYGIAKRTLQMNTTDYMQADMHKVEVIDVRKGMKTTMTVKELQEQMMKTVMMGI